MNMDEDKFALPDIYNFYPLSALRVASRRKLSGFLDREGLLVVVSNDGVECDVVNDYSGLAELAGFSYQDKMNIKGQKSPTTGLLDLWTGQNGTVGKLWMFLYIMERYDVLTDCRRPIEQDCRNYEKDLLKSGADRYNIEQDLTVTISEMRVDETKYVTIQDVTTSEMRVDETKYATIQDVATSEMRVDETNCITIQDVSTSEMRVDETKNATRQDVLSGTMTFYDAFICYTAEDENDRKFLYKMIEKLEVERGLKLFVPGRDDLPGSAEYTITAYLIEKRCTRVVILISRKFLQSAACDFQLKFAHALSPGARSKKLIPVIRERNTLIPTILRFLVVCDFTKSDMVKWAWNRLFKAIIAPIGPTTYFEKNDPSNPFNVSGESLIDIKFPSHHRLDEDDDTSGHMNRQSRTGSKPRVPMECDVTSMSWEQPTSKMQSQSASSLKCSLLPTQGTGQLLQKEATRSKKQSKPVPAKKPDKLKDKKHASYQRQQPPMYSGTISCSMLVEHFV